MGIKHLVFLSDILLSTLKHFDSELDCMVFFSVSEWNEDAEEEEGQRSTMSGSSDNENTSLMADQAKGKKKQPDWSRFGLSREPVKGESGVIRSPSEIQDGSYQSMEQGKDNELFREDQVKKKFFCSNESITFISSFSLHFSIQNLAYDTYLKQWFFSSPELKAQVSFSDHLLSVVRQSVCLSVCL